METIYTTPLKVAIGICDYVWML